MVKLTPAGYPSQDVSGPYSQGNWIDYEWIVVVGGLAAFFMAWGIGANDVANSFATSVGSKTLKMWQAVLIAAAMEFTGAMVLGGEVTKTVASDIARVEYFNNVPEIYMYGMLCSLAVAGTWLLIATYCSLAVSTTHSIIGSILGFALVYGGVDGVKWDDCKVEFPFLSGFVPVVLSWFCAPICAGIVASIIFFVNRLLVLRRSNSAQKAMWGLPILIFICVFINLMFVLSKGAKSDMEKRWPPTTKYSTRCSKTNNGGRGDSYSDYTDLYNASTWIGAAVGAGLGVIGGLIGIPLMKRRFAADLAREKALEAGDAEAANATSKAESGSDDGSKGPIIVDKVELEPPASAWLMPWYFVKLGYLKFKNQLLKGLFYDVHEDVSTNVTVSSIHEAAEVFDPHTEQVYKVLQVFSSACVAFAHGANDVANAIGPFSAIYAVYTTWQVPSSRAETDKWIFVLGGVGIVVGLATYGYNIIKELGVSLLKLTPSRGFSAELATGLTISLASFYGLPVSTTQTIVGAETGVGLVENVRTGLNFPILIKTFLGWIFTIILAALMTACLFSMGVYAPSVHMANDIATYKSGISNATNDLYRALNAENLKYNTTPMADSTEQWWTLAAPSWSGHNLNGRQLNTTLAHINGNMSIVVSPRKSRTRHFYTDPEFAVYWLRQMAALYRNTSVITVGQNVTEIKASEDWNAPAAPPAASGHRRA